jgi:hypothetical protein
MKFTGKIFLNQKIIALISLVLFAFLLVGALRIFGLYEGLDETKTDSDGTLPEMPTQKSVPKKSEVDDTNIDINMKE